MQLLRWGVLLLAGAVPVAAAQQPPLCSTVPFSEREALRSIGACRDAAPIIDVAPRTTEPAPSVIVPVPNVVGLGFDDARSQLAGFSLRRSYRASAEPGGTVLEQQPAPPTRLAAGAIVRLVLSDATLRPAPRVSPAEIDGVPSPAVTQTQVRPQPAVVSDDARAGKVVGQGAADAAGQSSTAPQSPGAADRAGFERLVVPNVGGMTFADAYARLGNFRVQRRDRPSSAPIGRVIEQFPRASARAAPASVVALVVSSGPARAATPVIETFELPNVIGRSYADASGALSEFKVARIDKPSDAPSGQVLAQDPAPGTSVLPGSMVDLQVSDGSLASAVAAPADVTKPAGAATPADTAAPPVTTPAAETTPATATTPATPATSAKSAPAQSSRLPVTFPSSATLLLIAGVLVGLGLGALFTRRWFSKRQPAEDVEPPVFARDAPTEIGALAVPETAPEIRFAARLDVGETTIEFAAPSDADETTMEYSRELHE